MKLLDNRAFKAPRGLLSRMRQLYGNLLQPPRHLAVILFQPFRRLVGILQFAQLRLDFIPIADHLLRRRAVFAVQAAQQIQSAFHTFGFLAVVVHVLAQVAQIARRVLHLIAEAVQPRVYRFISRIERGHRLQRVHALAQQLHRRGSALHAVAQQRTGFVER